MADAKTKTPDANILESIIREYCRGKHNTKNELCDECSALYGYALNRLKRCPHTKKPFCSKCKTPCYAPEYKSRIRAAMRYGGPRMLFYHPLALVRHLLWGSGTKHS